MADSKISALTDGGAVQDTDEFIIRRTTGNNKITGDEIKLKAESAPELSANLKGGGFYAENAKVKITEHTGTTYTFLATDTGGVHLFNNSSAITVTLPNDLAVGFVVDCRQTGIGDVSFTAEAGGSLVNIDDQDTLSGQYAAASITVLTNSDDESAEYHLVGQTKE